MHSSSKALIVITIIGLAFTTWFYAKHWDTFKMCYGIGKHVTSSVYEHTISPNN